MKVLHIITGLGNGGAEASLYRLCVYDKSNTHYVISLTNGGKYFPLLNNAGVVVYSLDMGYSIHSIKELITLMKLLKNINPDVVQTWLYHADFIGGVVSRLCGIKKVYWGIHNSTLSKEATPQLTRLIVKILSILSHVVPKRIVVCGRVPLWVHSALGYDSEKMRVINNGYDTEYFCLDLSRKRKIDQISFKVPLLGMIARYSPQKDHGNLFKALSILKSRGGSFACVLVGAGINEQNHELLFCIEKYGLNDLVYCLGEREDLHQIYQALDLNILSSAYGEGFPNVLCEAMACGVPCVATDVGDSSIIIGDLGWVVPPKDPYSLSNAIENALSSLDHIDPIKIRARIVNNYSISRMVSLYNNLWLEP